MRQYLGLAAIALALLVCPNPAAAQGKVFRMAASPGLIENGALKYLLPRFSLKTGIRIEITPLADAEAADLALSKAAEATPLSPAAELSRQKVFAAINGGEVYQVIRFDTDQVAHTARFLDWLSSDVGARALTKFAVDGAQVYQTIEAETAAQVEAAPEGDAVLGETLSFRHCGRCHVINEKNRFGGIGSTPSFGAMKTLPRWRERFEAFWTLNPHPAFTQVAGLTEPFDPSRPSPIAPLELTYDDVQAILAFVIGMKAKDLGAALIEQ